MKVLKADNRKKTHQPQAGEKYTRPNTRESIICVELFTGRSRTILFCCYRPPWQDPAHFSRNLQACIELVQDPAATAIVIGDFNARLSRWLPSDPNSPAGAHLSNVFDSTNLTQLVRQPTRYSVAGQTSSLLDLERHLIKPAILSCCIFSPHSAHHLQSNGSDPLSVDALFMFKLVIKFHPYIRWGQECRRVLI